MKEETEQLNATQDKLYNVECIKCAGETRHRVRCSLDLSGKEGDSRYEFSWNNHHQILQCEGCKSVSFRTMATNSEDYDQAGEDEWEYTVFQSLYPPRVSRKKGLDDTEALYLPHVLQQVYAETHTALIGSSPILAGIGLRALVEAVCGDQNAAGRTLFERIDDLVTKRVLTPAGAAILHQVRGLGNAAAHEAKPHTIHQLAVAMDTIEHLLKDVYILPKKMAAVFGPPATGAS